MRKLTSIKFPKYLSYHLFCSDAFRDIRPATREILILIYFEIEFPSSKGQGKKYRPTLLNRDDIKLPYDEIKDRLKYSHKTIWISFKEAFEHGFLEAVKNGGGSKGDCKIYKISEKWRAWEPGQIITEIGKNGKIGWQKKTKIS